MARAKRLTAASVTAAKHDGSTDYAQRIYDGDGSGLALNIRPEGTKSWVQIIAVNGRRQHIGLGPVALVSLREAREKAQRNKKIAFDGGDPIAERDGSRRVPTFEALAKRVIANKKAELSNPKAAAQWESTLRTYAFPHIGRIRVNRISVADIMRCVEPIWADKRETASRVRQRIGVVLDAAVAFGHRADNPATAAKALLPKARKSAVKHHKALPWQDVPAAVRTVRDTGAWIGTQLLFEFLVLTAARSGEARGATWDEIDLEAATWTVPAERMKARVAHRVPLVDAALKVLRQARKLTDPPVFPALAGCSLVFPSVTGKVISDATVGKLLKENSVAATPHGFRSSFRDWASECTDAPHAVMELSLAHSVGSAVEQAYARSDLFDRRRSLMNAWAEHVAAEPA